jgi:mRNA interferase HigB
VGVVKVHNKKLLSEFILGHTDVAPQVQAWVAEVEAASWRKPNDIKARYPSVSILGHRQYIFDLKGNAYRLEVIVDYTSQIILVRRIGTHADYEKWKH